MGGGGSQTIRNKMEFSSTTKILEENITENTNKVNAAAVQNNQLKLNIGDVIGCDIIVGQSATADVQSEASLTTQSILESKTAVQDSMQANLTAAMEKSTQAANFQFGDKQKTETDIKQDIETVIENVFKTENLNEVVASAVQMNESEITIGNMDCTLGGQLDITQDLTAKVAATAVMGQVIEKFMETESVKKLASEIDSQQTSENTGAAEVVSEAGDAVAGIVGAVTGPMQYAIIGLVVLCCLLLVGGVVLGMSPAGQRGMNKGFNQLGRMPMRRY
jgi:hypothetical protein